MHKTIILLFCLTLLAPAVLCPVPNARAESDSPRLIMISLPEHGWPPFIICSDKTKAPRGIMVDVMREISEAEGYELRASFFPEKRTQMMVREGLLDTFPKAMEWLDDPTDYLWTDPILDSTDVVVSSRYRQVEFLSPEDLEGLHVGLVHGYGYPKLMPLIQKGAIIEYRTSNTLNLLRMVSRGHVECAVVNPLVARWIISLHDELSLGTFHFSQTPLDNAAFRFAFTRDDRLKPFIERFNRRLAEMKRSGRLNAIVARYR